MSIQAVAWALEQDLPARPKLVLVSICNHADHTNGYAWLRSDTIAKEAACTVRSVFNYVGALVRNGYIRKAARKGDDGKQRANDYWIMFGREETPWEWGAHQDEPVSDDGTEETEESESEAQDVVSPHAPDSCGEQGMPHAPGSHVEAPEVSQDSSGPHAIGFTRYESAEPSKIKSKKESPLAGPPRSYRPPPPQPVEPEGAIADPKATQIFVYEGTRAWKAWVAEKSRQRGVNWRLTTTKIVDGRTKVGWYFPSLFPPERPAATGPPSPTMTEEDLRELQKLK